MFSLQLLFLSGIFVASFRKKVMRITQDFLSSPIKPNISFSSNSVLQMLLFREKMESTKVFPKLSLKVLRIIFGHSLSNLHY